MDEYERTCYLIDWIRLPFPAYQDILRAEYLPETENRYIRYLQRDDPYKKMSYLTTSHFKG